MRRLVYIVSAVAAFAVFYCISLWILPQYRLENHTVSIETLGRLNENGLADGVQVQKAVVDGNEADLTELFSLSNWGYENNTLTWAGYMNVENILKADVRYRKADIYFLTNEWCGGARVCVDGREVFSGDFYSADTGQHHLRLVSARSVYPVLRVFICLLCAVVFVVFLYAALKRGAADGIKRGVAYVVDYWHKRRVLWKPQTADAVIFLLLLFCLVQNASAIYNSRHVVETIRHDPDTKHAVALTEGSSVSQTVRIDAVTEGLALNFCKDEEAKGHVTVSIGGDGGMLYEKVLYVQSLTDQEPYELDIPVIRAGEYTITVSGMQGNTDDVSLALSDQMIFDKALVNGKEYDGNMALDVRTVITPDVYRMKIVLLAALLIVTAVALYYTCQSEQKAGGRRHNVFYLCSALLTALTICINFPCYSITPEFLWESGSDFYQVTYLRGIKGSLLVDEAGYWPLYTRLFADFVIHVLGQRKYAVFFMQGFVTLFTALVFARFCSVQYQNYADDKSRFAMSLFGGTAFLLQYGGVCLSYHNFAYFGIVLLLLNMLLDFKKLSRGTFCFVTLESSILCISKGRFGVIFPLFVLVVLSLCIEKAVCRWRQRESAVDRRDIVFYAAASVGSFIQIVYMLGYMTVWDTRTEGIGHTLAASFYYFVQSFSAVFIPQSNLAWDGWIVNIFFVLLLIFLAVQTLRSWNRNRQTSIHIAYVVTFIMGCAMLNAIMQNEYKVFSWNEAGGLPVHQSSFFMITGAVFVLLLCCGLIRHKILRETVFGVLLIVMSLRFGSFASKTVNDNCFLAGNWLNDYRHFDNETYVIPLWSDRRFMAKNAHVLYLGTKREEDIDTSQWNYTTAPSEIETVSFAHDTSAVFETDSLRDRRINAIYVNKVAIGMDSELSVMLYDENGSLLCRQKAMPVRKRLNLGFVFEEPVGGVVRIEFVNAEQERAEVNAELFIGVVDEQDGE